MLTEGVPTREQFDFEALALEPINHQTFMSISARTTPICFVTI